jgi:ribosomal protein S18 acetylase RimI-like enzyme
MDVLDPPLAALERLRQFKSELPLVDSDTCYLSRITVAESVRGLGFGQLLIRDFEQEALRAGCGVVSLHVRAENRRAIRSYEAAGYRTVSPPGLAYLGMHKSLPASAAA